MLDNMGSTLSKVFDKTNLDLTSDKLKVSQIPKIAPEQVAAAQAAIRQADNIKNLAEKAARQLAMAQSTAQIANARARAAKEAAMKVTSQIAEGQKITIDVVGDVISKATNKAAHSVLMTQSSRPILCNNLQMTKL